MIQSYTFIVSNNHDGKRIDKYLFENISEVSRNVIQKSIKDGYLYINKKKIRKVSKILKEGGNIEIVLERVQKCELQAENIPLEVIFEDKNMLIINKQPGICVHPANQHSLTGTIVNAILYHCNNQIDAGKEPIRPGIVHRLDKDTSGVLIIAKNQQSFTYLSSLFQKRKIKKTYSCLINGKIKAKKGRIEAPIGRSMKDRKKMSILGSTHNKKAITEYKVKAYYDNFTLVEINLITGRTHQIRVHFQSIGHPVIGDTTYGDAKINLECKKKYGLMRQFLHAKKISFLPYKQKERKTYIAPLGKDLQDVLKKMKKV